MSTPRPEEEQVRHLVASLRSTEPVPDDVVARLDRTLADLASAQPTRTAGATPVVVPLRRRAARILVAAAAVLAIGGVAASQLTDTAGGPTADSSGASADRSTGHDTTASARRDAAEQDRKSASAPELTAGSKVDDPSSAGLDEPYAAAVVPRLHSATFAAEVRRVLGADADGGPPAGQRASQNLAGALARCVVPPGAAAADTVLHVLLDGREATLVDRRTSAGRTVTAYACEDRSVLDSVTLR